MSHNYQGRCSSTKLQKHSQFLETTLSSAIWPTIKIRSNPRNIHLKASVKGKLESIGLHHYLKLVNGLNRGILGSRFLISLKSRRLLPILQSPKLNHPIKTNPTWTQLSIIRSCSQWGRHHRHLLKQCCQCLYFRIYSSWSSRLLRISSVDDKRSELSLKRTQRRATGSGSFLWRRLWRANSLQVGNSCTMCWWGTWISSRTHGTAWRSRRLTMSPSKLKCSRAEAFRSAQRRRRSCSTRQTTILISQTSKLIATIRREHASTLSTRASRATQSRTTQSQTKWRPSNDSTIHSCKMSSAQTKSFKSSWDRWGRPAA